MATHPLQPVRDGSYPRIQTWAAIATKEVDGSLACRKGPAVALGGLRVRKGEGGPAAAGVGEVQGIEVVQRTP